MHRFKPLISLLAALAISALLFVVGLWICSRLWAWWHTLSPSARPWLTLGLLVLSLVFGGAGVWRAKQRRKAPGPG